MKPPYLVTGANYTHARSLLQFLATVRVWARRARVVVYDLGLTRQQRQLVLESDFNGSVETFPWHAYPAFFDIRVAAGQYAWKPALIARELQKSNAPLCWMDAGNYLSRTPWGIFQQLKKYGFHLPASSGTVARWTHPLMLQNLGLAPDFCANKPNLNGACLAFDPCNAKARQLIEEWANLALDQNIIAPPGSSRANHRQDQALLTVLAYRSGLIDAPSKWCQGVATHRDLPEI